MENRNGLCVLMDVTASVGVTEAQQASDQLAEPALRDRLELISGPTSPKLSPLPISRRGRYPPILKLPGQKFCACATVVATVFTGPLPLGADPVTDTWRLVRKLDFRDAEERVRAVGPAITREGAESRFARGIALLGVQPRTGRRVEEAYGLFGEVVESGAAGALVPWALYYRARVDQLHRTEPDYNNAARQYHELKRRFPGHIAAQMGFVKLCIMRLYVTGGDQPVDRVLADLEAEGGFLDIPVAIRGFHSTLADAYLFFDIDREKALEHLIRVRLQGSLTLIDLGGELARIGNLAYDLGRWEMAQRYYREFLEINPDASSAYLLRERLGEMASAKVDTNGPVRAGTRHEAAPMD